MPLDAPAGDGLTPAPAAPSDEVPRKRLTGRLIELGAIPLAIFCVVYLLASRVFGLDSMTAQAWTFACALAGSLASLFVLAVLASRAAVGEVEAVRAAVRHVAGGGEHADLPELSSPLEELKHEVLDLAEEMQAQQVKMQERLDTARQQIFFLTNHDPLTGLPNRKALEERLESALASAKSQGSTHALLYLDVDLFHRINDSFGHLAGDDLLRKLAPVLQGSLREGEMLARIGGDEFAVLLENCSAEFAQAAATQLRDAVQAWQFEWGEKAFQVGVSIGVVAITRLSPSLSAILSEADTACFTAKEQGRNRVFAFHDTSTSQYMRQTSRGWLKRINDALTEGAFTLLYQPIVSIEAPKMAGLPRVEALLRMSETGGELILPMSFIPVAERYDLMRTIDRWVIDRAFADYRRLVKLRDHPSPAEFSINLSGHTLSSPDFAEFIRDKFVEYGVPPKSLYLEITETAAIANVERARSLIESLRGMGVRFLLDDFGSGLSSFNYLKHFPVDGLKVDGLFIKGVAKNYLDYALVESIYKIGVSLGLQTIAEYVENEDIARKLLQIGIPLGQGFHLAPPRSWEAIFAEP
ncbi:MAG TPA: EAL domain-containing protein [Usitatibacter sp.]|jgi:diguanylate cyclase (GGDEF)-like protein|nr:EAL domain-containing protein [Usitatibacter sp.]